MHYRLTVEYDGTDFHGWQLQPTARTVQGEIEAAVARIFGLPIRVAAAGRTDAGVHASGQVVSFRVEREMAPEMLRRAVNANTGRDLAVTAADIVDDTFDPRRAAQSRRYTYQIWNRPVPSPFWRRFAWHLPMPLDVETMARSAAMLVGEHDFSSFQAAGCDAAHPVRRITNSAIEVDGAMIRYEIEATAYLRHMVRNIVGTLVEVGQRRRSSDLGVLLRARDRSLAGATAPACGLCLVEVRY
jgi:tRNA pseudouridine38-40 synthase